VTNTIETDSQQTPGGDDIEEENKGSGCCFGGYFTRGGSSGNGDPRQIK
jgi:hypothetical protein